MSIKKEEISSALKGVSNSLEKLQNSFDNYFDELFSKRRSCSHANTWHSLDKKIEMCYNCGQMVTKLAIEIYMD